MALGNGLVTSTESKALDNNPCSDDEKVVGASGHEGIETLKGDDLSKIPGVKFLSP